MIKRGTNKFFCLNVCDKDHTTSGWKGGSISLFSKADQLTVLKNG